MAFDKQKIASSFNQAAANYEAHAILQKMVAERLLERLQLLKIQPSRIIDLGSGTGFAARRLVGLYRGAHLYQIDIALNMLLQAKAKSPRFFSKQHYICGDLEQLPLCDATADLIFSSFLLQWCSDLPSALIKINQTLKPQGLFLFTTLGPDTLNELRASWAEVDTAIHVNPFLDIHDLGDGLVRAGFIEPVIDVEHITMLYEDSRAIMRELKNLGAHNISEGRAKGLTGKYKFRCLLAAYEKFRQADGQLPATYEVIYGHAWRPDTELSKPRTEVFVPVSSLRLKK